MSEVLSTKEPLCISSEGGKVFNLKRLNSSPSINLTLSDYNSPCGCYSIAKAHRQQGFASYWVQLKWSNFKFKTSMFFKGVVWARDETSPPAAIVCRNGGEVTVSDVVVGEFVLK